MKHHNLIKTLLLLFFTFCLTANAVEPVSAVNLSKENTNWNLSARNFVKTTQADYLLFLPQKYDAKSSRRWPLILFLHGAGERGTNVWNVMVHGPAEYIENHPDFPFILVMPQCSSGHKWSDETLLGILDCVTAECAVDTNRIYLTGLSMGGYGTWSLATTCPERFAAVAPVSGGEGIIGVLLSIMDEQRAPALRKLPFWIFHGGKDNIVPLAESQRMLAALKKNGVKEVELTIYPEATHDCWAATYNNPRLYEWFLAHELSRANK
jgi:predicted peptidase